MDSPLEGDGFELPVPGERGFSFAERVQKFEIRLPPPMGQLRTHVQYPSPNPMALFPLRSRSFGRQFWKYRRRQVRPQGGSHERPDPRRRQPAR